MIDSDTKVDPLLDGAKEVEDTLANNYRVRAEPDGEGEGKRKGLGRKEDEKIREKEGFFLSRRVRGKT